MPPVFGSFRECSPLQFFNRRRPLDLPPQVILDEDDDSDDDSDAGGGGAPGGAPPQTELEKQQDTQTVSVGWWLGGRLCCMFGMHVPASSAACVPAPLPPAPAHGMRT